MAAIEQQVELRFRIFDGTDICQGHYPLSTNTDTIKERLLSEWPQDKAIIPTSVNDLKLIHAGQILGNGKTLAECRVCVVPRAVITMHVVVRPPVARGRAGEKRCARCLMRGRLAD